MNDGYDPASDAQSVAYHSDKIESPKQDPELDEYVEGSDKPINFSAGRSGLSTWKYQFSYDH